MIRCLAAIVVWGSLNTFAILHNPMKAFPEKEYISFETFSEWRKLVPELHEAFICSLTKAGHELWAKNQLRYRAEANVHGDISGTGRHDWAIQFSVQEQGSPCDHILIVTKSKGSWRNLFFRVVKDNESGQGYSLFWSKSRHAIGLDYGRRERETRAATMTIWSNGQRKGQTGYVREFALIREFITWDKESQSYRFHKENVPQRWDVWVESQ